MDFTRMLLNYAVFPLQEWIDLVVCSWLSLVLYYAVRFLITGFDVALYLLLYHTFVLYAVFMQVCQTYVTLSSINSLKAV